MTLLKELIEIPEQLDESQFVIKLTEGVASKRSGGFQPPIRTGDEQRRRQDATATEPKEKEN